MKKTKKYSFLNPALSTAFLVIALYFLFFFSKVFFSPNTYLHSAEHDGIKNYYTFAYHTLHSKSALHFEGMNYPFGEHVMYTDGQPLVGFLVGWMPFLHGYEIGLLNMLMYLSVFFGAYLLWKIFKELSVNEWIAAAGIVGIILLSPQFFRWKAHYALSYMWVIPWFVLLLIRLYKTRKIKKYGLILALSIFLIFLIHPYLGLMGLVFSAGTIVIFWIWRKFGWLQTTVLLGFVGAAAVVFRGFLLLTDTHSGRTNLPSGLFENYALPETIFLPYFSPFKRFLEVLIPIKEGQPYEGWGYIGLSVMLILASYFVWWLLKKSRRRAIRKHDSQGLILPLFVSSVAVLLFSMLIPMKWFSEEFIYKLGVLNQFRSLGRFSWVFYYVSAITAIVILNRIFNHSEGWKKKLAIGAIVLFPILNGVEAFGGHQFFAPQIGGTKNLFRKEFLTEEQSQLIQEINRQNGTALLGLPFYHVGSEHTFREGTGEIHQLSMVASYHSGLPLINSFLSRTSIPETISLFKLLVPEYNNERELEGMNLSNLLIVCTNQEMDQYEKRLINAAKCLYKGETQSLYKLDYNQYRKKAILEQRNNKLIATSSQIEFNGMQVSDSTFFYVNTFEENQSSHVFAGKGALMSEKPLYTFLASFTPNKEVELNASFWYYKGTSGLYNGMVVVEEIDTLSNAGQWIKITDAHNYPIIRDEWVLVEVPFLVKKGPYKYNLFLKGDDDAKGHFYVDNVLIKEQGIDCFTMKKEWLYDAPALFNNIPFAP